MDYKEYITSKTKNQTQEFEEDSQETEHKQVYFTSTPVFTNYHHRVFLDKEIIDEFHYREIIETIISANEGDLVEILISSPGGRASTCVSIINAIRSSKAFVRGVITSEACSAASIISLCCDELIAMPNSYMMIHNVSFGTVGSLNQVMPYTDFTNKWCSELYADVYKDFLTEDELLKVSYGGDMYLTADEVNTRVQRRQEIRQERVESAEAENLEEGYQDES